jgi:hypothetical protein
MEGDETTTVPAEVRLLQNSDIDISIARRGDAMLLVPPLPPSAEAAFSPKKRRRREEEQEELKEMGGKGEMDDVIATDGIGGGRHHQDVEAWSTYCSLRRRLEEENDEKEEEEEGSDPKVPATTIYRTTNDEHASGLPSASSDRVIQSGAATTTTTTSASLLPSAEDLLGVPLELLLLVPSSSSSSSSSPLPISIAAAAAATPSAAASLPSGRRQQQQGHRRQHCLPIPRPLLSLAEARCLLRVRLLAQSVDSVSLQAQKALEVRAKCREIGGRLERSFLGVGVAGAVAALAALPPSPNVDGNEDGAGSEDKSANDGKHGRRWREPLLPSPPPQLLPLIALAHTLGEHSSLRTLQVLSDELQATLDDLRQESASLKQFSEQNWTLYESLTADLEGLEEEEDQMDDDSGYWEVGEEDDDLRHRKRQQQGFLNSWRPSRHRSTTAASRLAQSKRNLSDLQDEVAARIDALLDRTLDLPTVRLTMKEYCRDLWPYLGIADYEDDKGVRTMATQAATTTKSPSVNPAPASASDPAKAAAQPPTFEVVGGRSESTSLPQESPSSEPAVAPSAGDASTSPSLSSRPPPFNLAFGQSSIPVSSNAASGGGTSSSQASPSPSSVKKGKTRVDGSAEAEAEGTAAAVGVRFAVQPDEKENSQQEFLIQPASAPPHSPPRPGPSSLKEIMDAVMSPTPALSPSPPPASQPSGGDPSTPSQQTANASRAAAQVLAGLQHGVPSHAARTTAASASHSSSSPPFDGHGQGAKGKPRHGPTRDDRYI